MMRMRRAHVLTSALLGLLLPVFLVMGGGGAEAAPEALTGRGAPELHVLGVHGGPSPSIQGLRGRWLLLEYFRTECPHCQEAVPHLNELQQGRFERGVRVIGLGFEPLERLQTFHAERKLAYPVAQVDLEVFRDYGVSALPTAFLVSPEGTVAWAGVPERLTLAELDRHLLASPAWPSVPPALEPAAELLRQDALAQARVALQRCVARTGCGDVEASAATALLAWIDRYAARLAEMARMDAARGDPVAADRAWSVLADGLGDRAARVERDALRADPARRREIEAGVALAEARARWRADGRAAGQAALDAVAVKHVGTAAGTQAAGLAERMRKRR
jgi:peroxiredoxin